MSRYWYGNNAGFALLTMSESRPVPASAETAANGNGAVRYYPVRWRSSAVLSVTGPQTGIFPGSDPDEGTDAAVKQKNAVGRPATYRPDLSRAEAKRVRERERYAAGKGESVMSQKYQRPSEADYFARSPNGISSTIHQPAKRNTRPMMRGVFCEQCARWVPSRAWQGHRRDHCEGKVPRLKIANGRQMG